MATEIIRRSDLPRLSDLYVTVFAEAPWNEHWEHDWATDRLSSIISSPSFFGLKTMVSGSLTGAALGRIQPFKGRNEYELVEFFVKTERQGAGVGVSLLMDLESALKKRGCEFCTLLTARNTPALMFYSNRGYSMSSKMVFMRKNLDQ